MFDADKLSAELSIPRTSEDENSPASGRPNEVMRETDFPSFKRALDLVFWITKNLEDQNSNQLCSKSFLDLGAGKLLLSFLS
jgi:hypothetical protein